jgi:hypothetical protein
MLLSFSVISFADIPSFGGDSNPIEIQSNNRYYYVTERGPTKTNRINISASDARNIDKSRAVAYVILAGSGAIGFTDAVMLALGDYIYDMGVAGYSQTSSTVIKRYKVNRLTGAKHLDSTSSELKIKVYAKEDDGGYSLHRSLSFTFRHK